MFNDISHMCICVDVQKSALATWIIPEPLILLRRSQAQVTRLVWTRTSHSSPLPFDSVPTHYECYSHVRPGNCCKELFWPLHGATTKEWNSSLILRWRNYFFPTRWTRLQPRTDEQLFLDKFVETFFLLITFRVSSFMSLHSADSWQYFMYIYNIIVLSFIHMTNIRAMAYWALCSCYML